MKRYSSIILIILVAFAMGCQKNLNLVPLNNITVPTFFKTESDIEEYVNGLYQYMIPGQSTPYFDAGSDANVINPGRTDETYCEFALGNYTSTTGDVAAFWNYTSIRDAYIFFQNIGNIPMSDSSRRLYTGSIDYLLAYQYFVMFRAYGSVPIVRGVLTPATADIASSSSDSVFAEALKWADSAVVNLPSMGPTQRERGKLTKLAALSLETDMLLFAASRYNQAAPGATWQTAAAAAQAALTEANAEGYGLATNYLDPFVASTQAGADAQKEIILENVRLPLIAPDPYGLSSYAFRPRYDGEGVIMFLPPQELMSLSGGKSLAFRRRL